MKSDKRKYLWIGLPCAIFLILLFCLNLLRYFNQSDGSRYTRNVESNRFSLGCEKLNDTMAESFELHSGDTIAVSLVRIDGRFDITIGINGEKPIYTGNDAQTGSFDVKVPEDGIYIITVSGKRAEGSVSFEMNPIPAKG